MPIDATSFESDVTTDHDATTDHAISVDWRPLWDVERGYLEHGQWRAVISSARGARDRQEDAFFVDLRRGMVVIADGMGGHARGDLASHLAVHAVAIECERERDAEKGLRAGFVSARRLLRAENGNLGTTLTACRFSQSSLVVAHLGDTRALIHGCRLAQVTRDHTVSAMTGVPGYANVLTSCVCGFDEFEPDIVKQSMPPMLLLTTDGVHGHVPISRIHQLLLDDPCRAADSLVEAAIREGTVDNATAVLLWRHSEDV